MNSQVGPNPQIGTNPQVSANPQVSVDPQDSANPQVSANSQVSVDQGLGRLERIRVRRIPDISPPVIDSRESVIQELTPFIQGTLAIHFTGSQILSANPQDQERASDFGPQRTLAGDLPEPEAWVRSIAQALVEVMSGARPAPQVIRWTTPEVYSVVARRNAVSGRRTIVARRAIVRQVRVCEPVDGVLEACAVVVDAGRVRALAMRLIGVDRRWVVSALQVG